MALVAAAALLCAVIVSVRRPSLKGPRIELVSKALFQKLAEEDTEDVDVMREQGPGD